MTLVKDIQPRGIASAYVVAPFDEGKKELERAGYSIISLEENARLRVQEGIASDVSQNGNWVREGFLYVLGRGKFLTKNSPIMNHPIEAVQTHRKGSDFYLTEEQVENGLANSIKLKDSDFSVPTKRFGEDEVTVFAFGNFAQKYGTFLKDAGITQMPVYMANNIGYNPFTRQAWLGGLGDRSGLNGNWGLNGDDHVRGVREDALASEPNATAEGGLEPAYSSADLELIRGVRAGDIAPKELERIISRFS